MCHLDKTSCSRYNTAAHFGMDAESAAARNAFWGEREVCGSSGPKTHFGRGVRGGGGGGGGG